MVPSDGCDGICSQVSHDLLWLILPNTLPICSLVCDEDCNVLQCDAYCAASADRNLSLRRAFGGGPDAENFALKLLVENLAIGKLWRSSANIV